MKIAYIAAACGVAFLGGFFLKLKMEEPCEPQKVTQAKEQTQERVETKRVSKTPDGKIVEVTKTEFRTIEKTKVVAAQIKPLSQYRIGLKTQSGLDFKPSVEATAGYRLNNSTWLESGYNIQRKEVSLGLSVEF